MPRFKPLAAAGLTPAIGRIPNVCCAGVATLGVAVIVAAGDDNDDGLGGLADAAGRLGGITLGGPAGFAASACADFGPSAGRRVNPEGGGIPRSAKNCDMFSTELYVRRFTHIMLL